MGDIDITIGSSGVKKRLHEIAAGVYADYVALTAGAAIDIGDVTLLPGTAAIGSLVMPTIPAEVVVAGAASTLGKIGTLAAAATVFVRVPCAATSPATARAHVRISADKSHSVAFYGARTVLDAPTITLASVQANDTVIINGLTFTAHADTTVEATGQFKIDGATDTLDADELVKCINTRFAALGITADAPAAVVTLTATTATTTQCVTGVGGARIVCAQGMPLSLAKLKSAPNASGVAANNTTAGDVYEVWVDGYPQLYVGVTNADAANPMTLVVGATVLAV